MSISRGHAWKLLGAPTEQVGSVNDPRMREEFGVRWNEKWLYLDDDDHVSQVVLWNRYDLAGAFRLKPDGSAEPLAIPDA